MKCFLDTCKLQNFMYIVQTRMKQDALSAPQCENSANNRQLLTFSRSLEWHTFSGSQSV